MGLPDSHVLTLGGYGLFLSSRVGSTPVTEIDYVPTLVGAIALAVVLCIVGRILLEVVSQSESYKADVRDRDIGRLGEYVGGLLLGLAMLVPFVLAIIEAEHFWIANSIYLGLAVSAFVGTAVKVVAYRRGL